MYNTQETAERIKSRAKEQKVALKTMLTDLELGINLISHLAKGQSITALNLARIADYLDCSVDYLLGRDEEKPTPVSEDGLSETAKQIMECVGQMSPKEQETFLAWLQASKGGK